MAEGQKNIGNYSFAYSLYTRALYFGNEDITQYCYIAMGDCNFQLKRYDESIEEYKKAFIHADTDSIKNELYIRIAYCYLFQNKLRNAIEEIEKICEGKNNEFLAKKRFHAGLIKFLSFNFIGSHEDLHAFINDMCPDKAGELENIFEKTRKIERQKKQKLWLTSAIVPGSGQIMNRDYKDGINSFLLNSSLIALTYYVGYYYGIPEAAFTVFPWSYRYYSGGIVKAKDSAKDRVKERHTETFNEAIGLCYECMKERAEDVQ